MLGRTGRSAVTDRQLILMIFFYLRPYVSNVVVVTLRLYLNDFESRQLYLKGFKNWFLCTDLALFYLMD